MAGLHHHAPGDAEFGHQRPTGAAAPFGLGFIIVVVFALIEAGVGLWAHSLALLSDAAHMGTDALALGLAALAQRVALMPASGRFSFGFERAESLAAFVNAVGYVPLLGWIVIEAIGRLFDPVSIHAEKAFWVALGGLFVNLLLLRMLHLPDQGDSHAVGHRLNRRAAVLHVIGDLAASVAAVVALALAWFTGWTMADPLLSLVIAGAMLPATIRIGLDAMHVLMDAVPRSVDFEAVGGALAALPGVEAVHDLHVWQMTAEHAALSAHLVVSDVSRWAEVLESARFLLRERWQIEHATLQPEPGRFSGETAPAVAAQRAQLS